MEKSPNKLYNPSSIRTYNMLPDRSSDLNFVEPSMTQQQFADECDINNIVASNASGRPITHLNQSTPEFADFGDSTDFHAHQNYLAEAREAFDALPSHVRARFNNDPAALLDFVTDEKNIDEAVKLGLATLRPEEPVKAPTPQDEPDFIPNPKKSNKNQPPAAE